MPPVLHAILVPVDGSEGSARRARYAAELSRLVGASITLLFITAREEDADDALVLARRDGRGPFAVASDAMGMSLDALALRTASGDPATAILRTARDEGSDLIVLGSRGLSPDEDARIGSVSRRVLGQAPCPILVVPH